MGRSEAELEKKERRLWRKRQSCVVLPLGINREKVQETFRNFSLKEKFKERKKSFEEWCRIQWVSGNKGKKSSATVTGRAIFEKLEFPDSEYVNQIVQFTKRTSLNIMFREGLKGEEDAAGLSESRLKGGKPKLGVKSVAQLNFMYTNARSMGNKKELEVMVQQQSYDVVAITEMWWDDSYGWSTALDGYRLFRRGRKRRKGGGVALYFREAFDAIGIETNEDGVECLWVRIKGKANKADILLGVCYHPPNQEEEMDNLFYKQLVNVSGSPTFVLVRYFNSPDICWELNTTEKRQSRKFLKCVEDNFFSQLVSEPTRTMLDMLFKIEMDW
ncbi:hypothetical protein HGM15179_007741 [Zosterops borbonicus]|uniref:Mitochondrial fission process protein 1 n=1 Tax=Zosterops borbonicus TaxID=364589 RepID=A0A8K1LMX0_9PASS|nr:hypothetical protein HGM15179_007741 [Zosterops borbonicus]